MMRFTPLCSLAVFAAGLLACNGSPDGPPGSTDAPEINTKKLAFFDCSTETKVDDKIHRIQFSVANIGDNKKVEILNPEGKPDENEFSPIKTTPTNGRVGGLNENLGINSGTRTLRISGDSDGFFLVELVLFKNTNYEHGFLRIFGSDDDGPNQFSKVHCTVKQ